MLIIIQKLNKKVNNQLYIRLKNRLNLFKIIMKTKMYCGFIIVLGQIF
jgi:hypothetical protein